MQIFSTITAFEDGSAKRILNIVERRYKTDDVKEKVEKTSNISRLEKPSRNPK